MDIKTALSGKQSKQQAENIAHYIAEDETKFRELMQEFFSDDWRQTQKAAWVLSHCADNHPQLIEPYIGKLVANLKTKPQVAVRRNTVRVLQNMAIPEEVLGDLADICFNYLQSSSEPVAVKVFAMTILTNICKDLPELGNELKLIIDDQLPYASAGFRSRAKKTFKVLDKLGI